MSFLYLIAEAGNGPVKIGICRDSVATRLAALQTGNPRRLNIIATWEMSPELAAEAERKILARLRDMKLSLVGEWVRVCGEALVETIPQWLSKIERGELW